MEVNPRILLQELADCGGFVSREIVQDDMNLLVPGAEGEDFLKEGDELAAGVASGGFAMNSSCGRVQSGIEGECSVAKVLETVAFGTSGRKRQNRVQPVQCLTQPLTFGPWIKPSMSVVCFMGLTICSASILAIL